MSKLFTNINNRLLLFVVSLLSCLVFFTMAVIAAVAAFAPQLITKQLAMQPGSNLSAVLAAETSSNKLNGEITFNLPSTFNTNVLINGNASVEGKLTAPNVLYGLVAGQNITISGDLQNPTISATSSGGVNSFQGQSGDLSLIAGSGITISGLNISSNLSTFKNIKAGSDTISAGSTTDTLEFVAGTGITLSSDTSNKKLTINGSGGLSGLTTNGVLYATSATNALSTGVGATGTVLHGTGGVPSFSAVSLTTDVTGILGATNGGTGADLHLSAQGAVPYFSTTGIMSALAAGTNGQCLTSGGTGANPSWTTCAAGTNLWQENLGALSPAHITDDLLIGGTSTASAKFAFINNIGSGIPTASISAGTTNNNTYLTGAGFLGTTNRQTLTIGGNSTGNISFQPGGVAAGSSLYLANSGNVGIGTTNPTRSLSVFANTDAVVAQLEANGGALFDMVTDTGTKGSAIRFNGAGLTNQWTLGADPSITGTPFVIAAGNNYLGSLSSSNKVFIIKNGGSVGMGTTNPLATLDVRGNSGTTPFASISGQSTFAGLMVDNSGTGDLFTASSSGATKFTILNNGNISWAGTSNFQNILNTSATTARTYTFPDASGTICLSGQTCSSTGIVGYWQRNSGALSPANITDDLLLGGTSTSSATFHVFGAAAFQGTNPVASIAANTSFAGLIVDNKGSGDIFTASKSGATKFVITNAGNVGIGTTSPGESLEVNGNILISNNNYLKSKNNSGAGVNLLGVDSTNVTRLYSVAGGNVHINPDQNANTFINANNANKVQIGNGLTSTPFYVALGNVGIGTTSPQGTLDIRGNSATTPIASISGNTNFAGMVIDNTGAGDIFTASKSGATKFVITNSGNVGIGTAAPGGLLTLSGTPNDTALLGAAGGNPSNASLNFARNSDNIVMFGLRLDNTSNNLNLDYRDATSGNPFTAFTVTRSGGLIGLGTKSPLAQLDIRGNSGTTPVASVSGKTAFAAMVVDNSGAGDLFTASSSGLNRFVITQNGNVGIGTAIPGDTLDVNAGSQSSAGIRIQGTGADVELQMNNNSALGASWFLDSAGSNSVLGAANLFIGVQGYNPAMEFVDPVWSGGSGNMVAINPTLGGGSTGVLATLDVKSGIGTLPVASLSGKTSFASLITDQSGSGDIFTASKSGATKFVITNAGNVGIGTNNPTDLFDVENNGDVYLKAVATGGSGQIAGLKLQRGTTTDGFTDYSLYSSGGNFYIDQSLSGGNHTRLFVNDNDGIHSGFIGIGQDNTNPLATLDVKGNIGTTPVASISGTTAFAAMVVDNSGKGDIFTASSSGLNRFVITQNGNVGIGTTTPDRLFHVAGGSAGSSVAHFENITNSASAHGVIIQIDNTGTLGTNNHFMEFQNSAGTAIGSITGNGTGGVAYNQTSDIRLKENIAPTHYSLDDLMKVQVKDYNFIGVGVPTTGIIAQQLYTVYPPAVSVGGADPLTNPWGIDYGDLTPLIIKGVQDEQTEIQGLQNTVYLTNTGNIAITPDPTTNKFVITGSDGLVTRAGVYSDLAAANIQAGGVTTQNLTAQNINTGALILAGQSVNDRLNNLENAASGSAQLNNKVDTLSNNMASLQDRLASLEGTLNLLASGSPLLSNFTASSAAQLGLDKLNANDVTIANTLNVLGRTTVSDLGVTGRVTIGLLGINGLDQNNGSGQAFASINTSAGPLMIQSEGLNGVNFLNGKVTIDTSGNIQTAGTITAVKYNVDTSAVASASLGTTTLSAGTSSIIINTTAVSSQSAIFVTPKTKTAQPLSVTQQTPGKSFKVEITTPTVADIQFNWWVVN